MFGFFIFSNSPKSCGVCKGPVSAVQVIRPGSLTISLCGGPINTLPVHSVRETFMHSHKLKDK